MDDPTPAHSDFQDTQVIKQNQEALYYLMGINDLHASCISSHHEICAAIFRWDRCAAAVYLTYVAMFRVSLLIIGAIKLCITY